MNMKTVYSHKQTRQMVTYRWYILRIQAHKHKRETKTADV